MPETTKKKQTMIKLSVAVIGVIVLIVSIVLADRVAENVDAGEVVVCQDPLDGELNVYTEPGLKYQNFGDCTHYDKSTQIWFSVDPNEGGSEDGSIKIRFNDGGHADLSGSVRADFPHDVESILDIHTRYGSQLMAWYDFK